MNNPKLEYFFSQPFPLLDYDQDYTLREQQLCDSKNFLAYYNDPCVTQFILADVPDSIEKAEEEINYCRSLFYKKTGVYWTLAQKKSNKMIGAIGYYVRSSEELEICYDLHKNFWKQGIMSKALTAVIQLAQHKMGIKCISAITLEANKASTFLLEKLGFSHDTTLPKNRYYNGKFHDVERYTLLVS